MKIDDEGYLDVGIGVRVVLIVFACIVASQAFMLSWRFGCAMQWLPHGICT